MEKYKIIVFVEEIRRCLQTGDTQKALELANQIDTKKVKGMNDLSVIAEAYFQNKEYKKARELFFYIYENNKSRRILAQMVHLSIKLKESEQALYYLSEFKKVAPNDFYQHIFQFSIDRMNGEPLETLIKDLETLKTSEYMENWGYELAKLYYKANRVDECIQECDDLALWFGKGEYVERAKALKGLCTGEVTIDSLSKHPQEKEPETTEEKTEEEIQEEVQEEVQEETEAEVEESPVHEEMSIESDEEEDTDEQKEIDVMQGADEKVLSFVTEHNLDLSLIFSSFLKVDTLRPQIFKCLSTMIGGSKKEAAMIITGDRESGKTRLGRCFAKLYKELDLVKSSKIALISAEKLNGMDLFEKKDQLRECVMMIEGAGGLTKDTIRMLMNLDRSFQNGIIIILEDTREEINKLLRNYAQLNGYFKNRVHLDKYTDETLLLLTKEYLKEKEYKMTKEALLIVAEHLKKKAQDKEYTLKTLYEEINQMIHVCDERNTEELRAMGEKLSFEHSSIGSIKKEDVLFINDSER